MPDKKFKFGMRQRQATKRSDEHPVNAADPFVFDEFVTAVSQYDVDPSGGTMDERSTAELIETLGDDVTKCHKILLDSIDQGVVDRQGNVDANYGFGARQLIRAIFAFIEGVTFSVKVRAAQSCMERGRDMSDGERFFAVDMDFALNNKGQVVERPEHIGLSDNIRFAFKLLEKAHTSSERFDPSVEWWSCLKKSVRVRDRLTHPKLPEDIDISGQEIIDALKAYEGFKEQLLSYREVHEK